MVPINRKLRRFHIRGQDIPFYQHWVNYPGGILCSLQFVCRALCSGSFRYIACWFFYFQYNNSRFRNKPHNNTIAALTGILIFSVNYFSNSGINGSTDLIWPSYFVLLLAISPYRQHLLWLFVYIVSFSMLHLIEYRYPSLVKHPFDLGKGEFIDRITAFPIPIIAITIIIGFLKKSYDKEKTIVEEEARAIELRNEQIVQQKQELEQINTEKNKLLSIISHDLRAPFANIQNYLYLLNENMLEGPERQLLENELLNATDQTMEMISNLLYWAKSQMEGVTTNLAVVELLHLLQNTLEIEKTLAGKKAITLNYEIDTGIMITADPDMLQLVVRNLINNAIKFTPQGGVIHINAQVLNAQCKVSIKDNGWGVPQDKTDTLFSMTSGSTFGTNNEKGVGLGLPLCKEFMERQGGSIGFESTPGQGSDFFILIPLSMPPDADSNSSYSPICTG